MRSPLSIALLAASLATAPALAQIPLTAPPDGGNPRAAVRQGLGLVEVEVSYSSPDVHAANGDDRRGKIWGGLVPWGYTNLGFGTCGDRCPWRGGANENTVFRVSHDVLVEGQLLAAGRYGLHFLPGESEWTVIFSRDADAWGSFFYDPSHDALRVTVQPKPHAYREWLTYEFPERGLDAATLELQWEDLAVPIRLAVPDIHELYYRTMSAELSNRPGFDWHAWVQGARYLMAQQIHLEEAERWAQYAVSGVFVGEENFTTLATLSEAQRALGKMDEAKATLARAVDHRMTSPADVYQYARPLLAQDRAADALAAFRRAAERFDGAWPLEVGVGRSYAALGDTANALAHLRKALTQAPDEPNRANLERLIAKLESGDTAIN